MKIKSVWRHIPNVIIMAVVLLLALSGGDVAAGGQPNSSPYAGTGEARLIFVGDVMLGRYVGSSIRRSGNYDAPFNAIKPYLQSADLAVANLEGPLVPPGVISIPPASPNELNLTGAARSASALARAGFDLVSLANNHALDSGAPGLRYTVTYLRRAGISPFGLDPGSASGGQKPVIRNVNGIRIAFLGYTDLLNIAGTSGVGYVRSWVQTDLDRMTDEVSAAGRSADLVVVMMHAGAEYALQPNSSQKTIASTAAAAGADLVVGAHPHVAQGMDTLFNGDRETVVAYSLGNALFDQESRPELRQGLTLDVRVGPEGVRSARLVPLQINVAATGYVMNLCDSAACPLPIERALQSSSLALKWQAVWSAGAAPSSAIAYRRDSKSARSSVEELGIGLPTRVQVAEGRLTVSALDKHSQWHMLWQSEPDWRVTGYTVGDANNDGRPDLVYTLWKHRLVSERPEGGGLDVDMEGGPLLPHIYINSWRDGELKPLWHGSPRPTPMLGVSVAPLGRDGKPMLATLESSEPSIERAPGRLNLWEWTGGFGFELIATLPSTYSEVWQDGNALLFR